MENYLLPATTYQAPARLARKHTLNTIIEDEYSEKSDYSESEGEAEGRGRDLARNHHLEPARSNQSTSPVPSLTSSVSSYYKSSRHSEDFDKMYDVSDDDSDIAPSVMTSMSERSVDSLELPPKIQKQNRYPSLVIPSPRNWPTIQKIQTISPPRPPKIPISPAALSMLGHDLPSSSNPPSLDGSLVSDPHAESSAPVTPDMHAHPRSGEIWGQVEAKQSNKAQRPELRVTIDDGCGWIDQSGFSPEDNISVRDFAINTSGEYQDSPILGSEDGYSDLGVQLPQDALDTLQSLSPDPPLQPDFSSPTVSEKEMEELDWTPLPRPSSAEVTPMSQSSEYSMSGMSIPSPSDFFSSLKGNARRTWCLAGSAPVSALPPSSATAEQFYNCPWNREPTTTVEQILEVEEVDDDGTDTDGPPTARQTPPRAGDLTPIPEVTAIDDHDEDYEHAIQEMAEKSLDRTSIWLAAQTSYMAELRDTLPVSEVGLGLDSDLKRGNSHMRNTSLGSPIKKAVRFLESQEAEREASGVKPSGEGDSIYYHAFQHIKSDTSRVDAFRHRHTRSDSIQSARISLPHEHLAQLQGQFKITRVDRPSPQRPISMMPGKEMPEETAEQKVISRVDRERQALEQVNARTWVIEAAKYLNGGKLLNSPATAVLNKIPSLTDIENGKVKCPARVLDLGGQPSGDWAWHCSREYQYARVYTASTEIALLESKIRGPRNHRPTAVPALWQLPYPDNYFNAISARSLFAFLKTEKLPGLSLDEYDLCLQECIRCLKPGGYLEYFLMDSEIVNAGTLGTAASVEFGFNLRTRGYDPTPTKPFLGRLRRAGFDDIKRAWTFLPMGSPTRTAAQLPETPPPNVSTFENEIAEGKVEAVQGPVGSTADAASMSGLVGSWAWEQWMVRLQTEMGKETLLEGVGKVLEEGKFSGAGWRCLTGWARKPL